MAYAPGPDMGTPKLLNTENTTTRINQNPTVAGTWYTATFSEVATGTKAVVVVVLMDLAAQEVYWKLPGSSWTAARQHAIGANPATGTMMVQALVGLDANKQVEFSSSANNARIIVWAAQFQHL